MFKVIHLSSVHNRYDNRILSKLCSSLAQNGYLVKLIVANGLEDEVFNGVQIIDVGKPKNRWARFTKTFYRITKQAIREKADLYHFHDPELIFTGLILRLLGYKVIYDIHEDYITSIQQKVYLPRWIAHILALFVDFSERLAAHFFFLIIAEKYYKKRFPNATPILNYPVLEKMPTTPSHTDSEPMGFPINLIYTGNVTLDRGAIEHAQLVKNVSTISITSVGKCPLPLAKEMWKIADSNIRLKIIGVDQFIKPKRIDEIYSSKKWTAGLALFPKTKHYEQKELTKFFEYMKYGIPVICSNFPVWKELIEGNECGYAVDSDDFKKIKEITHTLQTDASLRDKLGQNGRNLYLTKFNWSVEEKKLLKLYAMILKK